MSDRREVGVVLGLAAVGTVLLLVAEPATGLAVLAGAGAATLVGTRARVVVAGAVALLGLAALGLAASRSDPLLAAGGALVAAAAGATAVRVRRWPPPRPAPVPGEPPDEGRQAPRGRTPRDTWEALDRGEDPTA